MSNLAGFLFNPFAMQRAELATSMTPEEIEAAVRPHLFNFFKSKLPHAGLYGSVDGEGFKLRRELFQQLTLVGSYESSRDATVINLDFRRTPTGILAWVWHILFPPLLFVVTAYVLYSEGVVGPPGWVNLDAVWIAGANFREQYALMFLVFLASALLQTVSHIVRVREQLQDQDLLISALSDIVAASANHSENSS